MHLGKRVDRDRNHLTAFSGARREDRGLLSIVQILLREIDDVLGFRRERPPNDLEEYFFYWRVRRSEDRVPFHRNGVHSDEGALRI